MLNIPYSVARQMLTSPDTLATPLSLIMETALEEPELTYGADAVDPSTVFSVLADKYGVELHSAVVNRLQAVLLLRATEVFEADPDAFCAVALAFADGQVGDMFTGIAEPITAVEALWAVIEGSIVDPHMRQMQRPVADFIDDLLGEPTEEADEDDTDLADMFELLKTQLDALRLPADFFERLMRRLDQVMTSVKERYGDAHLV